MNGFVTRTLTYTTTIQAEDEFEAQEKALMVPWKESDIISEDVEVEQ